MASDDVEKLMDQLAQARKEILHLRQGTPCMVLYTAARHSTGPQKLVNKDTEEELRVLLESRETQVKLLMEDVDRSAAESKRVQALEADLDRRRQAFEAELIAFTERRDMSVQRAKTTDDSFHSASSEAHVDAKAQVDVEFQRFEEIRAAFESEVALFHMNKDSWEAEKRRMQQQIQMLDGIETAREALEVERADFKRLQDEMQSKTSESSLPEGVLANDSWTLEKIAASAELAQATQERQAANAAMEALEVQRTTLEDSVSQCAAERAEVAEIRAEFLEAKGGLDADREQLEREKAVLAAEWSVLGEERNQAVAARAVLAKEQTSLAEQMSRLAHTQRCLDDERALLDAERRATPMATHPDEEQTAEEQTAGDTACAPNCIDFRPEEELPVAGANNLVSRITAALGVADLAAAVEKAKALSEACASLEERCMNHASELESSKEQLTAALREAEMAKNSKTEILKRIKGKFESLNRENGELKRQIDDQTEVIDSLNRTVVNKEEEIYRNGGPDALKELEGTKAELEFLRSSLDLTDASVKESVELGGQLWCLLMKSSGTQVVIAASEISTDVEFPKPTYSDLQEELDSLRRESALNVSEYEEQLKAAHENFERFKNRSSAITKQSASYQSLSAVRGEQVLALEREIEELKTDLANAQQPGDCTREQELESCLEENERQAVSLNAQVSLLTEQLAKAKSDVHSVEHAELRKLRHEQSQNEGQIASLGESLHTYAEKITELQNKLHVERTASRALASDLEALRLKAETPGPSVVLEAVSPLTEPGSEPETTENVHFLASDNQSRRLRDSLTKLEIELQDTRSERSMMHEQVKLLQGELRNAEAVSNLHSSVNTKPVNAEYLRNTLIRFLETGRITSSEHESLVPVICHLLSVSAEQAKTIEEKRRANAGFTRFFGL